MDTARKSVTPKSLVFIIDEKAIVSNDKITLIKLGNKLETIDNKLNFL